MSPEMTMSSHRLNIYVRHSDTLLSYLLLATLMIITFTLSVELASYIKLYPFIKTF